MSGRHLSFPFRIGPDGRTATPPSVGEHVKGEVVQLLLTNPGERPFLPEFGGGVRRLVFEANDEVVLGVAKAGIAQALATWLGERVKLEEIAVEAEGAVLSVGIRYEVLATGERKRLKFVHEL